MSKKKTPDIRRPLQDVLEWMNHGAEPKQAAFLTALIVTGGNKLAAAEAASVSRSAHYKWIEADENYRTLFERAHKQAGEALEDEARRRAKEGVEEIVYFQGVPCGIKRVYSDSLMQFLLRGAFPQKYRERYSGTIDVNVKKFKGSIQDLLETYRKLTEEDPEE